MRKRKISLVLVLSLIIGMLGVTTETKRASAARINLGEAQMNGEVSIVLDKESYSYTGQPIEPDFQVIYKGTVLTAGVDYDYMIRDNVEVGWGLIIVDGAGEYEDRISKQFKIESETPEVSPTPTATAEPTATPSATPAGKYKIGSYSKKVKLNQSKVTLFYLNKKAKKLVSKTIINQFRGHMTLFVLNAKSKASFSSSNYGVATVNSSGVVTAVKPGKCTVTAKVGSKKYKCKVTVKKAYAYSKSYIKKHVKCSYKDNKKGVITMTIKNKMSVPVYVSYWLDEAGAKSYWTYDGAVPAKKTVKHYIRKWKPKAKVKHYRTEIGFTGGGGPSKLNGHYDKYEKTTVFCYGFAEMQPVTSKQFSIRYSNLKVKKVTSGKTTYNTVFADVKITNKLPYGVWWTIPYNAYALFYKNKKLVSAIELYDYDIAKSAFGLDKYYIPKGFRGTVKQRKISGLSKERWNGKYDKVKVVYNTVDLRTDRIEH